MLFIANYQYISSMRAVRKKHFSNDEKRAAIELWRAKIPLKDIRKQLEMSESTLRRILAFAKASPSYPIRLRKPVTGRKCKVLPAMKRAMKTKIEANPTITAKQLKKALPVLANISIRRIQHICQKDLGLPSRKMSEKPLINERMKQQRLAFAREYENWGVEDWKKVMFSDESHFELRFGNQASRCRRARGSDRFAPQFTKKTVKHPEKVMAWGCFSWMGRGGLEFLNKGEMMNGPRYLRILDEKLEFFMAQHATSHFLQDGAPCHRAKMVTAWFKDRPNIQLIRWPGNSPDLNPIENVWAWMKRRLRDIPCTNMKQWREEITRLWVIKMADSQYLRNLVESMPRRLNEVIEREGATTGY